MRFARNYVIPAGSAAVGRSRGKSAVVELYISTLEMYKERAAVGDPVMRRQMIQYAAGAAN